MDREPIFTGLQLSTPRKTSRRSFDGDSETAVRILALTAYLYFLLQYAPTGRTDNETYPRIVMLLVSSLVLFASAVVARTALSFYVEASATWTLRIQRTKPS